MGKLFAIIVLVVVLAGGLYFLKNKNSEPLANEYKCNINGVDYFVKDNFVYLMSKEGKEYIYTDIGVYERKEDKTGWTLTFYTSKPNIYETVFKWMKLGQHPTAGKVTCEKYSAMPTGFSVFEQTHKILFDMQRAVYKE